MREGDGASDGALPLDAWGADTLECEVGGYIVRARRSDTWDAIVGMLVALDTDHGPAFQTVLKRLSDEGAFEGIVSTDDDRKRLRAWIDEESARLDAERLEFDRVAADIERQRVDVERTLTDLNARVTAANAAGQGWPSPSEVDTATSQRDDYNRKATDANERAARDRADIEHFNREVARYNLMLVYPDGMDANSVVKTKTIK